MVIHPTEALHWEFRIGLYNDDIPNTANLLFHFVWQRSRSFASPARIRPSEVYIFVAFENIECKPNALMLNSFARVKHTGGA